MATYFVPINAVIIWKLHGEISTFRKMLYLLSYKLFLEYIRYLISIFFVLFSTNHEIF